MATIDSITSYRRHRSDNFTITPNGLIGDPLLSFKAKGILIYLLSKPEHWQARYSDILAHGTEGEFALISALNELCQQGYMVRSRERDPNGRWVSNAEYADYRRWPADTTRETAADTTLETADGTTRETRVCSKKEVVVITDFSKTELHPASASLRGDLSEPALPDEVERGENRPPTTNPDPLLLLRSLSLAEASPGEETDAVLPAAPSRKSKTEGVSGSSVAGPSEEAIILARLLVDYRRGISGSRKKLDLVKWARDIDTLMRVEGADANAVADLLEWVFEADTRDSRFWSLQIRSGDGLRRHFERAVDVRDNEGRDRHDKEQARQERAANWDKPPMVTSQDRDRIKAAQRRIIPEWMWDQLRSGDLKQNYTDEAERRGLTLAEMCEYGHRDPVTFEPLLAS